MTQVPLQEAFATVLIARTPLDRKAAAPPNPPPIPQSNPLSGV